MRIAEVHLYSHDLPVKNGPYSFAGTEVWSLQTTLVKLVGENGAIGWGETCPLGPTYAEAHAGGARAALTEMAPGLVGADIHPKSLHRKMDSLLNGHNYAKAAVDIAAHDLLGKSLGLRVADLLGGAITETVPSYYAIGIGTPDENAKIARAKAAEGYTRLQMKVGGQPLDADIEMLHKIREAVGPSVRLAADANRGLTARDTIQLSTACADVTMVIEQPCNTLEEIASIKGQLHHPVFLDESSIDLSTVIRAVGTGLCEGFGMKLGRIGGLQPMSTFRDICDARSVPHTCDDSWGGDIVAAACTHIGATVDPKLLQGVWLSQPYIEGHYDSENGIEIVDGHITLPSGPGLGITPDETLFGAPFASFS